MAYKIANSTIFGTSAARQQVLLRFEWQVMLVIVFNLILMGIEVNITLGRPAGAETPTIFLALNIGIAP